MFIVFNLVTEMKTFKSRMMSEINLNLKDDDTGMVGILPVYQTREQAEKEFPGSNIIETKFR